MKLRNKKTGEIFEWKEDIMPYGLGLPHPKSLAEINEEWEDYKPTEPLIKDKKIRKAVRAWAEANKEEELEVMGGCSVTAFKSLYNHTEIDFNCSWKLRDSVYTIEELCGEEEE